MIKRIITVLLFTFFAANVLAEPVPPATNKDGSVVSGFLRAEFDPLNGVFPFPWNFLFNGSADFTLNTDPFVEDPTDFSDPFVALGALDGFSTTERWVTTFSSFPNTIDTSSVVPGQSVRLFEVKADSYLFVTEIVRELVPGVEYVATMATDEVLAIIPLKPLQELTNYMAVLTNDINDSVGNDATPSPTYHLTKAETPWLDENGSTSPFFDDASAASLEALRQITASMETAAETVGIPKEDIILSWTANTQSITAVTKNLRSIARPAPTEVLPAGQTTASVGGAGLADLYLGVITLPYYLGVPSAGNPIAPLTDFWQAEPGAYIPEAVDLAPFPLDPDSTNVTIANPFPVKTSDQTVPLLLTVPNANSRMEKPAAGWPVVIFGHGLGGNRTNLLGVADTLASVGYAVIGIDTPLHGITPQEENPFYVENTPWADMANERTFNVDYIDNATGAPGPDGIVDPSGIHYNNLVSLLTGRDNSRQAQADLSILAVSLPFLDFDGDGLPDLDASTTKYAGMSMGGIHGTVFTAVEPYVTSAFLSVPAGGLARALEASQFFGPIIRQGLAALNVLPGTTDYELFFTIAQTVLDSMDPINWGEEAARLKNVVLHEVIDDIVLPNFVPTAPLSGTEPLIATMGLTSYSTSLSDPAGIDGAGRFVPPADHSSLLLPTPSPATTAEMQKQLASFIVSNGTAVAVENSTTMVPVSPAESEAETEEVEQ